MKRLLFIFLFLSLFISGFGQGNQHWDSVKVDAVGNRYYALTHLPGEYFDSATKRYPLLIYMGNETQTGNAVTNSPDSLYKLYDTTNKGTPYWISVHDSMDFVNPVDSKIYKFIVVSIQAANNNLTQQQLYYAVNDIVQNKYRVDTNRIYITGSGYGGYPLYYYSVHTIAIPKYPFAAIAPLTAQISQPTGNEASMILADSVHVWSIGDPSNLFGGFTKFITDSMNAIKTGYTHFTNSNPSGYGGWGTYFNPAYKENLTIHGTSTPDSMNIYMWMLQFTRLGLPAYAPRSTAPRLTISNSQIIELPLDSVSITGTAFPVNSTINSTTWNILSKPINSNPVIKSPSALTTEITKLDSPGVYTVQFSATNDSSQTSTTTSLIRVYSANSIQKIHINTWGVFWNGDTSFLQVTPLQVDNDAKYLWDEQDTLDPQNGKTLPIPVTFPNPTYISNQWVYPLQYVVDLGATYSLPYIWIAGQGGTDTCYLYGGSPNNWQLLRAFTTPYQQWSQEIINPDTTRYVLIKISGPVSKLSEVVFYGAPMTVPLSMTRPQATSHPRNATMGQLMGVDVFSSEPDTVDLIGGNLRQYENQDWLDTTTTTHNVDSLKFNFDIFRTPQAILYNFPTINQSNTWYQDSLSQFYQTGLNTAQQRFSTLQGNPQYFQNLGYAKPMDSIVHPNADPTNPISYDRIARMAYNYASVFGHGNVARSNTQLYSPYNLNKGLVSWVENGNEMDARYGTFYQYYNPLQYWAYSSAFLDGNNGSMGAKFGLQQADTSMKMVMTGLAYLDTQYVKALKYYSYWNRADRKFLWNAFNYHYYDNSNGIPYADSTGISPEQDSLYQKLYYTDSLSRILNPTSQVWYTEFGWDRNSNSPQGFKHIPGLDSATVQAMWIMRGFLAASMAGMDRVDVFQIRNDALSKDYDSTGIYTYNTTGLTSGHLNANGYHNYSAFPSYYYMWTMWKTMYNYYADSIVRDTPGDSVWIYRYKNANRTDSLLYAVWCPTSVNKIVSNFKLNVGLKGVPVNLYTVLDSSFIPAVTHLTSDQNGYITMNVTEKPQFVELSTISSQNTLIPDFIINKNGASYLIYFNPSTNRYYIQKVVPSVVPPLNNNKVYKVIQ